ncbi:collagen binding domain-containing protein [Bulleidia sp. zg-1006]|uniref:MSCRAMM family protein n=1 Tax=Bulleidia sp. zg-1006 TaxID=2806552 RepID=UPI001939F6C3|nr:SpaA isopeptide-forming pilin-related protein [Bulleidia sp. zg-1006]QRG87089.1 hypothetical protein JOS54_01920 [Bulleidia sp. zg-1006]
MRKKKQAIWIWIFSIMVSLVLPVYAEQLTVVRRMEYTATPGPIKNRAREYISYVTYQGRPAICIDPKRDMHFGNDYHKKSLKEIMGSNTERLNHFMAYAFENGVGDGDINYAAAQMYAWALVGYQPSIQKGPHSHQEVQKRIQEIQKKVQNLEKSEIELKDLTTKQVVMKVQGKHLRFTNAILGHRYQVTRKLKGFQLKKVEGDIQGTIVKNQFVFTVDAGFTKKSKKLSLQSQSTKKKNFALIGKSLQNLMIYDGEEVEGFDVEIMAKGYRLGIRKEDVETKHPQGDVSNFNGTKYQLLNKEGKLLGTFILQNGKSNYIDNLLPDETYYLKEIVAPMGMRLHQDKIPVIVKSAELSSLKENTKTIVVQDQVKTGTFSIQKYLSNSEESAFLPPEEKAEFIAILSKHVQKYGGFAQARKHLNKFNPKEYAILTTDEKGYAKSSELAYGSYEIRQTKAMNEEIEQYQSPFFFTVQEDHQHQSFVLKNVSKNYYLRILKLDKDTKQSIQKSSATFRITRIENEKGQAVREVITQRIGSKLYSLFSTNSKGLLQTSWQDAKNSYGELILPLALPAGKYEIEEVESPKGYEKGFKKIVVLNQNTVEEKGKNTVLIPIENKGKYASFHLQKKWDERVNEDNFAEKDFPKIQFELRAKEDIYANSDGTRVMKKGDLAKNIFGQEVGSFFLDKKGKVDLNYLHCGKYELKEVQVAKGVELDQQTRTIELSEKPYFFQMKNSFTRIEFSKMDENGKEVQGAELVLKDENGAKISSWYSKKEAHCIQGLEKGRTYILEERVAPKGYSFAKNSSFRLKEDGSITKVQMMDGHLDVRIQKVDEFGHGVTGAKLQLLDEKREKVLKEWVSDGKDWNVSSLLKADSRYWIHEVETPFGYHSQEDQLIHISKYAKPIRISFLNQTKKVRLQLEKREKGSQHHLLANAHYRVFHKNGKALKDETGAFVDLISNEQGKAEREVPYAKDGYFIRELKAPKGYEVDVNPIPVHIEKDYSFNQKQVISLRVEDKKKTLVKTGDKPGYWWYFILSVFLLGIIFTLQLKRLT